MGALRNVDFRRLWVGQTVSIAGSTVTREAIPFTAILLLGATPFEMGLLGAAAAVPGLLLGLFVGVWVDRVRRRPLMIAADLARSLLVVSIPVAYLFGGLTLLQLYVVAAATGLLTIVFDVASTSYLPGLLPRADLLDGNSKLQLSESVGEIAAPPVSGALVQLIGGPLTLLLDGVSYLASALLIGRIRGVEQVPERTDEPRLAGLTGGLRLLWVDARLRALTLSTTIRWFFGWFFGAVYTLYALQTIGLSPALVGVTVAMGGAGALVAAVLVGRLTRAFGAGPVIVGGAVLSSASLLLLWAASGVSVGLALALLIAGQLLGDAATVAGQINETTLRQSITAPNMLGRVNAASTVLAAGTSTAGLLVGGLLGETVGLTATVAIAAIGSLAGCAPLWPIWRVRALAAEPQAG